MSLDGLLMAKDCPVAAQLAVILLLVAVEAGT